MASVSVFFCFSLLVISFGEVIPNQICAAWAPPYLAGRYKYSNLSVNNSDWIYYNKEKEMYLYSSITDHYIAISDSIHDSISDVKAYCNVTDLFNGKFNVEICLYEWYILNDNYTNLMVVNCNDLCVETTNSDNSDWRSKFGWAGYSGADVPTSNYVCSGELCVHTSDDTYGYEQERIYLWGCTYDLDQYFHPSKWKGCYFGPADNDLSGWESYDLDIGFISLGGPELQHLLKNNLITMIGNILILISIIIFWFILFIIVTRIVHRMYKKYIKKTYIPRYSTKRSDMCILNYLLFFLHIISLLGIGWIGIKMTLFFHLSDRYCSSKYPNDCTADLYFPDIPDDKYLCAEVPMITVLVIIFWIIFAVKICYVDILIFWWGFHGQAIYCCCFGIRLRYLYPECNFAIIILGCINMIFYKDVETDLAIKWWEFCSILSIALCETILSIIRAIWRADNLRQDINNILIDRFGDHIGSIIKCYLPIFSKQNANEHENTAELQLIEMNKHSHYKEIEHDQSSYSSSN